MAKAAYFSLFQNKNPEHKDKNTFRVYTKGSDDYEDKIADYFVGPTLPLKDGVMGPRGSGIKDKSAANNNVIRVNVGVVDGDTRHYYRGTLNFGPEAMAAFTANASQPKGEQAGVFGTFTDKNAVEMKVSGWVRKSTAGDFYISCVMQEPYVKPEDAAAEPA